MIDDHRASIIDNDEDVEQCDGFRFLLSVTAAGAVQGQRLSARPGSQALEPGPEKRMPLVRPGIPGVDGRRPPTRGPRPLSGRRISDQLGLSYVAAVGVNVRHRSFEKIAQRMRTETRTAFLKGSPSRISPHRCLRQGGLNIGCHRLLRFKVHETKLSPTVRYRAPTRPGDHREPLHHGLRFWLRPGTPTVGVPSVFAVTEPERNSTDGLDDGE